MNVLVGTDDFAERIADAVARRFQARGHGRTHPRPPRDGVPASGDGGVPIPADEAAGDAERSVIGG